MEGERVGRKRDALAGQGSRAGSARSGVLEAPASQGTESGGRATMEG